jgi:hypothetical protein
MTSRWGWTQPTRHALSALLLEQECEAEAVIVGRQLQLAAARADVAITASCACRLSAAPQDGCCGGDP